MNEAKRLGIAPIETDLDAGQLLAYLRQSPVTVATSSGAVFCAPTSRNCPANWLVRMVSHVSTRAVFATLRASLSTLRQAARSTRLRRLR